MLFPIILTVMVSHFKKIILKWKNEKIRKFLVLFDH